MAYTALELPPARYDHGGDESVFVELDQAMSLEANFKAMAITSALAERNLEGVLDICPSNASYLVRVEPGRTIALVEVMKNFNEIKTEQAGTIGRFLVQDGDEVAIGQDVVELQV